LRDEPIRGEATRGEPTRGEPLSFAAAWLALREPHDHAARAAALTDSLCDFLGARATGATIRILDLACGSGSTLRYLSPRLGGLQHWKMVDRDKSLLALLPQASGHGSGRGGTQVEPLCLDLADPELHLPLEAVDLVTASALLDLVSARWLDRLVAAVRQAASLPPSRPALLLALSYDGSMRWQPALADDDRVAALFNRHQRTDKGFGPALGPAATDAAARRLQAAGFTVTRAASPWRLGPADQAIQRELASGIAAGAADMLAAGTGGGDARLRGDVRHWLAERLALVDAGRSTVEVGHDDLLALPPVSAGG
jgi:SAM-dependent methyltransferase